MADEDLLIGQTKEQVPSPGASGIQVPMNQVTVSVFGVFKDSEKKDQTPGSAEEYVEQRFRVAVPKTEPNENIAQFIWVTKFLPQACLRTVGSGDEISFYPLDRFKRFTMTVGVVVGVTL